MQFRGPIWFVKATFHGTGEDNAFLSLGRVLCIQQTSWSMLHVSGLCTESVFGLRLTWVGYLGWFIIDLQLDKI